MYNVPDNSKYNRESGRNDMSIKIKKILLVLCIVIMSMPMTVMAADSGNSSEIRDYLNEINGGNLPSALRGFIKTTNNSADVATGGTYDATYNYYDVSTDSGTIYYIVQKDRESEVIGAINNVRDTSNFGNNIDADILGGYDLSADTETATGILSGVIELIPSVLGIMVVLATVGVTVFTGFDILYLIFPVFRNTCDEKAMSGGPATKKTKDGTNRMWFVTDEAIYAVRTADTVNQGQSPLIIYFKKAVIKFVVLAILIFILLTGNVNIFAKLAIRIVQGVLDILGQI